MSAYFIANYQVTDAEAYFKQYIPQVTPITMKHGGEVIAFNPGSEGLEGQPQPLLVVVKFSNREAAEAWYNDPEYQPVKAIRHAATTNGWATICDHFVPPSR